MRQFYTNGINVLLIFAIAFAFPALAQEKKQSDSLLQDYKLQLAAFSILNADPVPLGNTSAVIAAPRTIQSDGDIKMVPISELNKPAQTQMNKLAQTQNDGELKMTPIAELNKPAQTQLSKPTPTQSDGELKMTPIAELNKTAQTNQEERGKPNELKIQGQTVANPQKIGSKSAPAAVKQITKPSAQPKSDRVASKSVPDSIQPKKTGQKIQLRLTSPTAPLEEDSIERRVATQSHALTQNSPETQDSVAVDNAPVKKPAAKKSTATAPAQIAQSPVETEPKQIAEAPATPKIQTVEPPPKTSFGGWTPVSRKKNAISNDTVKQPEPIASNEFKPRSEQTTAQNDDLAAKTNVEPIVDPAPPVVDPIVEPQTPAEPKQIVEQNLPAEKEKQPEKTQQAASEPVQPQTDTRMFDIVENGLKSIPEHKAVVKPEEKYIPTPDVKPSNENSFTNDNLKAPSGLEKFTFDPFAEAERAKIEAVNGVPVKVSSFDALTPGAATINDVVARWGKPANKMENQSVVIHQYLHPLGNVASEVQMIFNDNVLTTIIVQLEQPESVQQLENAYKLSDVKFVVVYKPDGTPIGQAYPERGVSLVYANPAENQTSISRLILEPIQLQPFLMRAETELEENPLDAKKDLEYVLNKNVHSAEAHWLYGRVLESVGNLSSAIEHLEKAVYLDTTQARYYINLSSARAKAGLTELADKAANRAIELASNKEAPQPYIAAQAWQIKGDIIVNQANPNYKMSLECHSKAIELAQPLATSEVASVSYCALQTLIDAHLGAANDIAWGNWGQKAAAVSRWLNQANKYNELLIKTAKYSEKKACNARIHVASKALSAIAGVGKEINPEPWANLLIESGEKYVAMTTAPIERKRLRWNMGMSLYDAVQVFQARKDPEMTLRYGIKAVENLEAVNAAADSVDKISASDLYIQGRLYFRLGAIFAITKGDHQQAVKWYSKSLPIFETIADAIPRIELGRLGETLVSMGVSYWEIGKQNQAVNLTENGIYCLEQAVEEGLAGPNSVEIPYRNISMMLNYQGKKQESSQYLKKADAIRTTVR